MGIGEPAAGIVVALLYLASAVIDILLAVFVLVGIIIVFTTHACLHGQPDEYSAW